MGPRLGLLVMLRHLRPCRVPLLLGQPLRMLGTTPNRRSLLLGLLPMVFLGHLWLRFSFRLRHWLGQRFRLGFQLWLGLRLWLGLGLPFRLRLYLGLRLGFGLWLRLRLWLLFWLQLFLLVLIISPLLLLLMR